MKTSPAKMPGSGLIRVDRALSLAEAMGWAATRNLSLLQDRLRLKLAALTEVTASVTFIPTLNLDSTYANSTPFDTSLSRDHRLRYGASVDWKSPIGTAVSAGVALDQRLKGATRQSQAVNTANHSSNLHLSVAQPLLKGAGTAGAYNVVAEARVDVEIQRQLFRQQLNTLLRDVEHAYWDLAFAQLELDTKDRARKRAKAQFEDTRENIRRGIVAKIEIYLVEENLVFFRQELLRARQNLDFSRRKLAQLLRLDTDSTLSTKEPFAIAPLTRAQREGALTLALRQSPLLGAEQLRLKKRRIQLAFEKNQALPSLDLVASLRLNGLDADYAEHLSQMATAKRPDLTVGLVLALPWSFRANRARVDRTANLLKQDLYGLKAQEDQVRRDTGGLIATIAFQQQRLKLATRRVELSRLKLAAEVKKYKNGISTLDSIVRFQRELDQATLGQWRIHRDLRKSRSSLLQVSGSLNIHYGIRVGG